MAELVLVSVKMHAILIVFAACLGVWLAASPLIWAYWTFRPSRRENLQDQTLAFVFMGALIGMGILCAAGFEAALFFIPRSLGWRR